MGYVNAEHVLPQALIQEIQRHVDGVYLYIPRKTENKRRWGVATNARRMLRARNAGIFQQYEAGKSAQELAREYYLSSKTIQGIIAGEKKRRTEDGRQSVHE